MSKLRAGSFAVVSGKRYKTLNGKVVLIKSIGKETALTENSQGQLNNLPISHLKELKDQ